MKIAVFLMAIMVMVICTGSISEEKHSVQELKHHNQKNCRFPTGRHGAVRTEGCIKHTCSKKKWISEMRTDMCCYNKKEYQMKSFVDQILSADNCSSTTLTCGTDAKIAIEHNSCGVPATTQQVENFEIHMEKQINEIKMTIENITVNMTCGMKEDEIYETVQDIKEMEKNTKEKVENLAEKMDDIENITESIKTNNMQQSEEISDKMNDVVKKIDNNTIHLKNHVKNQSEDLAREIQENVKTLESNLTDQVKTLENNNMQQSKEISDKMNDLVKKIDNNKIYLKNHVKNQSEDLAMIQENVRTLESNLTDQVKILEYKMERHAQKVEDNQKSQADLAQTIMSTLANLTLMLEKHAEDTPLVEGILITGGYGAVATSTELYLPGSGKTCSLQQLPAGRHGHSMDTVAGEIILCGGGHGSSRTSCLQFLATSSTGSWAHYATLAQGRFGHTSNVFQDQLMLMGGQLSQKTTEILGKGPQYDLQLDSSYACSIPDQASYILTGGGIGYTYYTSVVRYNYQGYVETLPGLTTARRMHGCGYYLDRWNNKVLVVAGGGGSAGYLSSTEVLTPGASAWTSGQSLPRKLYYPASLNIDGYLLLIGGYDGSVVRGEVLKFAGTWTDVGRMKTARYYAAVTKIQLPADGSMNISACN